MLVIGHAAAAGEAPANTLAGVRACLRAPVDAMEVDVQLCADGVPVLLHDETLDRTTNLRGPVRHAPLAALQAADAGAREPVPALDQVLELVAGRCAVFAELKATPGHPELDRALVQVVAAVIERRKAQPWVGVHSFSPEIVRLARVTAPEVSAALISSAVSGRKAERLLALAVKLGAQAVSVEHGAVDGAFMTAARRRQLTVWAWTADSEQDWARLAQAGVDGVITNVPSRLRAWIRSRPG